MEHLPPRKAPEIISVGEGSLRQPVSGSFWLCKSRNDQSVSWENMYSTAQQDIFTGSFSFPWWAGRMKVGEGWNSEGRAEAVKDYSRKSNFNGPRLSPKGGHGQVDTLQ